MGLDTLFHPVADLQLQPASTLQDEANQARFGDQKSGANNHTSSGWTKSFEGAVAHIPKPLASGVALVSGILARFPGNVGLAGKVAATGLGLAYGSDLAFRLSETGSKNMNSAIAGDSLVLATLGAGFLGGARFSSSLATESSLEALAQPKISEKLIEDWTAAPTWAEGTAYPKIRQEFLDEVKTYSAGEQAQMKHALAVAEDAHLGQLRKLHIDNPVRDPYIIHPVRSALILMKEAGVRDAETVSSTILHDVVEDSGGRYTLANIGNRFGDTVRSTVGYVTKPETINGIKPDLTAYYAGVESAPERVRLVKLADRLDNMRDTATIPDLAFQKRKLAETIDHYVPIAEKTSKFFADQLKEHTQSLTALLRPAAPTQIAIA